MFNAQEPGDFHHLHPFLLKKATFFDRIIKAFVYLHDVDNTLELSP